MTPPTTTRFSVVAARPAPPRRNLRWPATLLVLVLVAAGVAAGSALTVRQRQDTAALFAERYTVAEAFVVEGASVGPAAVALPAAGVPGAPVEMTAAVTHARTPIQLDHWVYTVTIKETASASVTTGQWAIDLTVDGNAHSTIVIEQKVSEQTAIEGVRASFDLGTILQSSSLYYIVIRPYVPTGTTIDAIVRSNADLTWIGVGGSIDGAVNPSLSFAAGSTLRLTGRNADGGFHNIGIKSGGNVVTPPGWSPNIAANGEEALITWTPTAAGSYTYQCQYHPSMKGDITVT